jgi:hypothetical protein
LLPFCHICLLLLQLWGSKSFIPQSQLGHIPNSLNTLLDKWLCPYTFFLAYFLPVFSKFPSQILKVSITHAWALLVLSLILPGSQNSRSLSPTHQYLVLTLTSHSNSCGACWHGQVKMSTVQRVKGDQITWQPSKQSLHSTRMTRA